MPGERPCGLVVVLQLQRHELGAPEAPSVEHGKDGSVSRALWRVVGSAGRSPSGSALSRPC